MIAYERENCQLEKAHAVNIKDTTPLSFSFVPIKIVVTTTTTTATTTTTKESPST